MDVILYKISLKKIKSVLVFFCVTFFLGCDTKSTAIDIELIYEGDKAVSVLFKTKSETDKLQVYIQKNTITPILGAMTTDGNSHSFIPVIPFTPCEKYQIKNGEQIIGEFMVAPTRLEEKPKLEAIYPSNDTIPENLLKMYFIFSEPMQEVGNILDFITVFDNTDKSYKKVFLELPSHLWNREHNRLTLWLDPGRIKTDLIPNKREGLPVNKDHSYTLKIDKNLKSAKGIPLRQSYSKVFYVNSKDTEKPNLSKWQIGNPKKDSKDTLIIKFNEPMDAILAKETILIKNSYGRVIDGKYALSENEQQLNFYPKKPWPAGTHEIEVLSIFEDLAGNNLNHLFDNNLKNEVKKEKYTETKSIPLIIE
ncbi:Ig-like domain-containing protein [Maribacter sp. 2210JD10-5]|uniref:Ig-like domain-containing protein n=1 Tax=Maribacter sp. 2210JD10-5 TaxID=3386272 RepID=UPI0039BCFAC7